MGRSDYYLKLEVIKKIIGVGLLLLTMNYGVMAMAYSLLVSSFTSQIINSWPNKKLLGYGYLEQIRDILPGILLAVVMGIGIYPVVWIGLSDFVTLCIQIPLGAIIYILGSKILKLDEFNYIWNWVKQIIKREKDIK